MRTDLEKMPLPWLALRLWVWQATRWLADNASVVGMGLALAAGLTLAWALAWAYWKFTRPLGVPPWAVWLAPGGVERFARPAALAVAWPDWEKAIRAELTSHGEVMAVDLQAVPAPFRRYALKRYGEQQGSLELLEIRRGRVRLQDRGRVCRWQAAGQPVRRDYRPPGELASSMADAEAQLLAEALGCALGEARDLGGARVYQTTALDLPQGVSTYLLLVWLIDGWIGVHTVNMLVELLKKDCDGLALVVPPEGDEGVAELRQAMARLSPVQNFAILSRAEILALLIAREPCQRLGQRLLG